MKIEFETLDDFSLHQETLRASSVEKSATLHLLECLYWIEQRRAFRERGFSSLFEYVHRGLGYSEQQASERVRAMRITYSVAEIKKEIEGGRMTLTAAARLATHVKRMNLAPQKVVDLVPLATGHSVRELERLLLEREAAAGFAPREMLRRVSATHTEIRAALTEEGARLLEEARDLDANPGASLAEILEKALRFYVAEKRKRKTGGVKKHSGQSRVQLKSKSARVKDTPTRRSRYISRAIRRMIYERAQGKCQFIDSKTGRPCDSQRSLTLEHRIPFSFGGANTTENLALYCSAHNTHTAEKLFGQWTKEAG